MKYFVSGANGQLGKEIRDIAKNHPDSQFDFFGKELNITDKQQLIDHFEGNKDYDIFINCAAYTNVDNAEEEKDQAFEVNHRSLENIIELSNQYDFKLIHISTDFVFDGAKTGEYNETDLTAPISIYGESKLDGEQLIIDKCKKYIIIRTSWLYSKYGNNFVKKIIALSRKNESINVVSDETGTPTNAADLAKDILFIAEQRSAPRSKTISKLYHYANAGSISRFEFAKQIVEYADIDCKINPVNSDFFNFAAKRPKNSSLDKSKIIQDHGLSIRHWDIALKECIKNILSDEK